METQLASPVRRAGRYLLFRVARQDFAMRAERIRAILPARELIALDRPHPWMFGFAAVSGHGFPVVDLRGKLGIAHGSQGRIPCIVVMELSGSQLAGFIADRVSDVVTLHERDFRGVKVLISGRVRHILEPDQILSEQELLSLCTER